MRRRNSILQISTMVCGVNITPLQKAGLFAVDRVAKKEMEKAMSDLAEW